MGDLSVVVVLFQPRLPFIEHYMDQCQPAFYSRCRKLWAHAVALRLIDLGRDRSRTLCDRCSDESQSVTSKWRSDDLVGDFIWCFAVDQSKQFLEKNQRIIG